MEIEIIDWVIVGLLVFTLFGLSTAVNAVMDIKERQGKANEVLGDIRLEVEDINRKMERLMP
jgi:hypothetical protein